MQIMRIIVLLVACILVHHSFASGVTQSRATFTYKSIKFSFLSQYFSVTGASFGWDRLLHTAFSKSPLPTSGTFIVRFSTAKQKM
jgi:hypothetical protein